MIKSRGSCQMTDLRFEVAQKIVGLRRVFAHHPAFLRLEEQFRLLLERRRAELAADISLEARGIAVIGASGSGKTSAVARLLSHTPGLVIHDDGSARADVVSFQVPSPATLKFVGQTALEATGYPMFARRTEMVIWAWCVNISSPGELSFCIWMRLRTCCGIRRLLHYSQWCER